MNFLIMLLTCFVFSVTLCIVFLYKNKVHTEETKIYSLLIFSNLIGIILEAITLYLSLNKNYFGSLLYNVVMHLYFGYILFFLTILLFYVYSIYSTKENANRYKKLKLFSSLFLLIGFIFVIILPVEQHVGYATGPAVNFIYIYSSFIFSLVIALIILNRNNLKINKIFPFFLLGLMMLILTSIQRERPEITISTAVHFLTVFIMYHTIENPDIHVIELEKKNAELAVSANEAKSAFLSSMSHELRTPLNAIVGLSEDMLSYQDRVPNEVKEDCNDIINASNTLLEIIGNILDISKIEGGKLEIIEADYLPKEEIESLLKIMRTKVEEKELNFNVYIDPNIPECLYGDRLRIKQIINNFLSNAIKYTEKGSIDFGARWINNSLELKVRDTGRGIKKEDMDKLFEKFERLHVEKTSAVQGTGLGLAITKNLVNLMGGTIKVDSEFGVGSTFDVIIPQKLGNKDNIVRESLTVEEKHDNDYTGKKVLVVDDNKLNIKVLRKAIASYNFEIDECYNGEEAINKVKQKKYDLILMDIMMPVMGGEEALSNLKQNPDFNTPVIALTADATTGAKEKYMASGFVDYLTKPFSRDTIAKKLDNIFENTK